MLVDDGAGGVIQGSFDFVMKHFERTNELRSNNEHVEMSVEESILNDIETMGLL